MHGRVQSPHCRALTRSGHSPLGPPQTVLPGQFPLLFYMCGKLPLFIKLSTVNVYKNYIGRSVRVRITVSATFQIFALTAGGGCLRWGELSGWDTFGQMFRGNAVHSPSHGSKATNASGSRTKRHQVPPPKIFINKKNHHRCAIVLLYVKTNLFY